MSRRNCSKLKGRLQIKEQAHLDYVQIYGRLRAGNASKDITITKYARRSVLFRNKN